MTRVFCKTRGVHTKSGRVFGLDLMRASAISFVLVCHASSFFPLKDFFTRLLRCCGPMGVDLFFALSGFLIGGILFRTLTDQRENCALANFWMRRWLRTLPNYFLFLLVNIALAYWLGRRVPSLWEFVFFLQSLTHFPSTFFLESWSLAVEEWFYLAAPILLFAAWKIAPARFCISSLFIIVASIAVVTVLRGRFIAATRPMVDLGTQLLLIYRLDACMFGVLAAWVKHFFPDFFPCGRRVLCALGILLVGFALVNHIAFGAGLLFFRIARFTISSLGAMMLLPLLDSWKIGGAGSSVVIKTSLWSYALYLANVPVRTILRHFVQASSPWLLVALYLCFSFLVAAFIYSAFEKPILDWRDRRHSRSREKLPAQATFAGGALNG